MAGLSFLYPVFLLAGVAIAIPIVLHLLRRRTEVVVEFPAVRLLERVPVEQHRRRRLRELLLLALRVTALALLAFAFARPFFRDAAAAAPVPVTVVALDTSMSLSAPGQFDQAREAAKRAIQEAPATHQVAVVTFADAATLAMAPTIDRVAAAAAIDAAAPSAGGTRFRPALARASETILSGEGRIVVVTDLQQAGWDGDDEGAVADGLELEIVEVPPPLGNVAVTAVRRDGEAVVAAVHNFGIQSAKLPVTLRVGEQAVATETVELAPEASAEVRFTAALPASGGAEVLVDDRTGYRWDNSRYFLLDPPDPVPVIVITASPPGSTNAGLYVERALEVADRGRAFDVRVMDGRSFSQLSAEAFGEPGALIVLGTTTLGRAGRERIARFLREGGRALLTLGPDIDAATLADTVGLALPVDEPVTPPGGRNVTLVAVDRRHPVFRPFLAPSGALGDVYVETYRRLSPKEGATVLARFSGAGDALVEHVVGDGRLLVFASDLDNRWNRFPLNAAFVPWAVETARYLVQGRELRRDFTLPETPLADAAAPGVHRVGDRPITVNVDVRESNPARIDAEAFLGRIARFAPPGGPQAAAVAREQEEQQRLWQIGLLVMLLALASEGFIGRRAV